MNGTASLKLGKEALVGGVISESIFNLVSDCLWLVSVEHGNRFWFRAVNDSFLRVTGFTREDVLHRPMEDWFPPGSLELVKRKYRQVVTTRRPVRYEETTDLPAGRRVGKISVAPILDSAGQCTMLLGTAHDVTEPAHLRDREAALLRAQKLAHVGTYVISAAPNGPSEWSQETFKILGINRGTGPITREAYIERIVHPDDRARVEKESGEAIRKRRHHESEYRIVRPDGTIRFVRSIFEPVPTANQTPEKFTGFLQDITESENKRLLLRKSEEQFRHLVETARMIAWERPVRSLAFTYVSGWAEDLLGWSLAEWRKAGFFRNQIVHPDDRKMVAKETNEGIRRHDDFELEYRLLTADGRTLWFKDIIHVVKGGKGPEALKGFLVDITERKRAEEALRESEMRQRLAIEGADLGLWDWHVPTGAITVNERWWANLGYRPGEVEPHARSWKERVHPDDWPAVLKAWTDHSEGRTPRYAVEYRLKTKNGTWVWVLDKGLAVERDPQGRPVRVCGTHLEITARKMAEEAMQASETRFRQVTEAIEQVFWMTSVDKKRMLFISPGYERIWGRTCQSLYDSPQTWLDSVHPGDRRILSNAVTTKQASGEYDTEYRIIRPDGSVRWIRDRAFPVRNALGKICGVAGVADDITDRKQIQEDLQDERDFSAAVLQTAGVLILVLDQAGHIIRFNRACEHASGYKFAEVKGRIVWDFLVPARDREFVKSISKRLKTERSPILHDSHWLRKNGEERLISWTNTALRTPAGKLRHIIRSGIDITEWRRIELQLANAASGERRRIGRNLHDGLGQQLTALGLMCHSLEEEAAARSPGLARNAREIGRLLREAVQHVRQVSHGLAPVLDGATGLADALRDLARILSRTGKLKCHFLCPKAVATGTSAVASELYLIAQEAVNNAIRHGKAGRITISLRGGVSSISLRITDNGKGLARSRKRGAKMGVDVMTYRANLLGGRLSISSRPRKGVSVLCSVPTPKP